MNAKAQLAIAESCMKRMEKAGIRFAIVCSFPSGGGAFLSKNTDDEKGRPIRDENGDTMPQLMRFYAKWMRETVTEANNIGGSEQ